MQSRRISREEQAELVRAIRNDEIENATAFAQEFAEQHGLNPTTVRSRISRLRRELGVLTRQFAIAPWDRGVDWTSGPAASTGAFDPRMGVAKVGVVLGDDLGAAEIAAAALVRYEDDEEFRRAVDRRRPGMENLYSKLKELRAAAAALSDNERDDVIRLLLS